MNQTKFGFIITRHVISIETNKYWNLNVKLLRILYPFAQIVVIDDNSIQKLIVPDFEYKNLTIIQSEYPARGELLPYIYYLKYRWFENAIILHDSVFIHKRIPFETFNFKVLPLWHETYDKENLSNLLRLSNHLNNNHIIKHILTYNNKTNVLEMMPSKQTKRNEPILCFGAMAYINYQFLQEIDNKYAITKLTNAIHCRNDRCGLERIMGIIFLIENPRITYLPSLFGSIFKHPHNFKYNLEQYEMDFKSGVLPSSTIKIWTGR
jgi:hypothetical protein